MKILACKVGKSRLNYDICKYFFIGLPRLIK